MKTALCVPSLPLSGIGTSIGIIRRGLLEAQHDVDVVITSSEPGDDCERVMAEGWSIKHCGQDVRFMRDRLRRTLECLSSYDVIINNHSIETQLVAPCLSHSTVKISTMRGITRSALELLSMNSRCFQAAVAISQEMKRVMTEAPGIKCPVFLVPNCTDVSNGGFSELKLPAKLAYVGRIRDYDKNIGIIPDIIKSLREQNIAHHMAIAGDGRDLEQLKIKIGHLNVGHNATLYGKLSRDKARAVIKESHFTLLPSFYEGLSNVMLEAMALGSVPIASDLDNFKWVLGEEFDRLTSPVKHADGYARRIVELVSNPAEYGRIQQYLWKRQRTMFTPDVTVNGYLKLIDDIQVTLTPKRDKPPGLDQLRMPPKYARQCTQWWRLMQKARDRFRS
jgi:glycosyltransferase involved in cell wall biosynthesis